MWYTAIGGGRVDAAQLLLDFGANIDQSSRGTTALHWAAARGQLELAAFLLENGANPNARSHTFDRAGLTPLELAIDREQAAMVAFLRERGAM